MKVFNWIGTAVLLAMVSLTACSDDAEKEIDSENILKQQGFGVSGSLDNSTPILYTSIGKIYSASLFGQINNSGQSYEIIYKMDMKAPENQNVPDNEAYKAQSITVLGAIKTGSCKFFSETDTTQILTNEIAIENVDADPYQGIYLGGNLFLINTLSANQGQKNKYELYWPNDCLTKTAEGYVYNIYLRATKEGTGMGNTPQSATEVRSFNIQYMLDQEKDTEARRILKINYLSRINPQDKKDLTWKSFTVKLPVIH